MEGKNAAFNFESINLQLPIIYDSNIYIVIYTSGPKRKIGKLVDNCPNP